MTKPIKIYAENIEAEALEQFHSAMANEHAVQGALMPDAHAGYSLPIGGVVATKGAVFPAWVGYDQGCGMCAIPTSIRMRDLVPYHTAIFEEIYKRIPTGFSHHQRNLGRNFEVRNSDFDHTKVPHTPMLTKLWNDFGGYEQIGTLGGGNHFIEIGYDSSEPNGTVWIVLHSGSRGIGWNAARHYMCVASDSDKPLEGHYPFLEGTKNYNDYLMDMNFCLEYALANRKLLLKYVFDVMVAILPDMVFDWNRLINRNHNHATLRNGLWIHRKGATHAEEGMLGVIPGTMAFGSFIVRGKGNPESLWSSSHGAGRVMSRGKAKRQLSLEDFKKSMEGITAPVCEQTLDEAPKAYKDPMEVMELQRDLVDKIVHIKPLISIKGYRR